MKRSHTERGRGVGQKEFCRVIEKSKLEKKTAHSLIYEDSPSLQTVGNISRITQGKMSEAGIVMVDG